MAGTSDDRAFSLLELMVVALVIAILLGIATPAYLGARARAQEAAARQDLRSLLVAATGLVGADGGLDGATAAALASEEIGRTLVDGATAATATTASVTATRDRWSATARTVSGTCVSVTRTRTGGDRWSTASLTAGCRGDSVALGLPTGGLVLLLDARDLDADGDAEGASEQGITAGAVTSWADRSGRVGPMTVPAAFSAPLYDTSGINGRPAVVFGGAAADAFLRNTSADLTLSGDYSVFVLFRGVSYGVVELGTAPGYTAMLLEVSAGTLRFLHRWPASTSGGTNVTAPVATAAARLVRATFSDAADTMTLAVDGAVVGTATGVTTPAFAAALRHVSIGNTSSPGARLLDGAIAAVAVYDHAMSAADIDAVDDALATGWGITLA